MDRITSTKTNMAIYVNDIAVNRRKKRMILNCQNEPIDFDMSEAEKLEKRFEEYMELGC